MTMPINLVLVRHGESEGNVAMKLSKSGDNSLFTEDFRNRHSSRFRLSPTGREQALIAGGWLRHNFCNNVNFRFDRFVTSEYVRAMETAALLGIPEAVWYVDFYLRERNWGELDNLPDDERKEKFGEAMRNKDNEPMHWAATGGETIAEKCRDTDRVLHTLHRECSDKNVLVVCHGETMWTFKIRLERMTQDQYRELDLSKDPHDRIHNCQILHYTRRDPFTGELAKHANWMRSICPSNLKLSSNKWQQIVRPRFSNHELLARVEQTPSFIEG